MSKKVYVIIPAFNESEVIGSVVKTIAKEFAKNKKYHTRIVVVDDGSKDNTAVVARSNGAYVIEHMINWGAGSATATGLRFAEIEKADIAVTMDGDGQHSPKDVVRGVNLINDTNADLLIGSRLIDNSGMSLIKTFGNKGLSFVTYLLFGVNVTDSQSGLRVFSKNALQQLRWQTSGYEFCSEMLWRAKQLDLVIREYSVKAIYTDYSKAKGQNNWNGINIVKTLIKRRLAELFS